MKTCPRCGLLLEGGPQIFRVSQFVFNEAFNALKPHDRITDFDIPEQNLDLLPAARIIADQSADMDREMLPFIKQLIPAFDVEKCLRYMVKER